MSGHQVPGPSSAMSFRTNTGSSDQDSWVSGNFVTSSGAIAELDFQNSSKKLKKPLYVRVEYAAPVRQTTVGVGGQGYMFLVADSSGTLMVQAFDAEGGKVSAMLKVGTTCRLEPGCELKIARYAICGFRNYLLIDSQKITRQGIQPIVTTKLTVPFNFTDFHRVKNFKPYTTVDIVGKIKKPEKMDANGTRKVTFFDSTEEPLDVYFQQKSGKIIKDKTGVYAILGATIGSLNGIKVLHVYPANLVVKVTQENKGTLIPFHQQRFIQDIAIRPSKCSTGGNTTPRNTTPSNSGVTSRRRGRAIASPSENGHQWNSTLSSTAASSSPRSGNRHAKVSTLLELKNMLNAPGAATQLLLPMFITLNDVTIKAESIHRYFACIICHARSELDGALCYSRICKGNMEPNSTCRYAPMLQNITLIQGETRLNHKAVCFPNVFMKDLQALWLENYDDEDALRKLATTPVPEIELKIRTGTSGNNFWNISVERIVQPQHNMETDE